MDRAASNLAERMHHGAVLLLDGATGTELERRGVPAGLPLWSTHALLDAPAVVRRIARDYAEAGADILTANTFRTQRRTLERAGLADRARDLTVQAVELARQGAAEARPDESGRLCLVAGSAPPLEDCYHPERVPDDAALAAEHREHAENLAAAGVDLILVETMGCIREACAALDAARAVERPVFASFICAPDVGGPDISGPDFRGPEAALLSGESLRAAIDAVSTFEPSAILVNCVPPSRLLGCLPVLAEAGTAFGVYPNLGSPTPGGGRSEDRSPSSFATLGETWLAAGARVVGGCCGTTPDHIRALADRLRSLRPFP
jgi:S-methylmethionine-dependent homocysteine/selenocysteine methylase